MGVERVSGRARSPACVNGSGYAVRPAETACRLRLLAPKILGEPVEPEPLERLRPRPASLAVEADLGVPGVEHLFPLRPNGLALRGAVHGCRAIARGRILHGPGVAAAERGRAVDGGSPAAEAQGLVDREGPARRRRESTAD